MAFSAKAWFRSQIEPYLKKIKSELAGGLPVAKITITNTTANYAVTTKTVVPIGASFAAFTTPNFVKSATNEIEFEKAGVVELSGAISLARYANNVERNNTAFYWEISRGGGAFASVGAWYMSNYIRFTQGHNKSSQEFSPFLIDVAVGDKVRMAYQRVSGAGGTVRRSTDAESAYINIKMVKED